MTDRTASAEGGLSVLLLLADGRLPAGGHAHSGGIEEAVAAGHVASPADLESYLDGRLATTGRVDAAVAVAVWRCLRFSPGTAAGTAAEAASTALAGVDAEAASAALAGVDAALAGIAAEAASAPLTGVDAEVAVVRAALAEIDAEASARMASPAQRAASRAQGRGLLRVARRCWSAPVLDLFARIHDDGPLAPMVLGGTGAAGAMTALEVATAALWSVVSGPAWAAVRLLGLDPLGVTATLAHLAPAIDRDAADAAEAWGRRSRAPAELPAAGAPLVEIGAELHAAWEVRLFAS